MDALVVNCGSSSIKADVLDAETGRRHAWARAERIGEAAPRLRLNGGEAEPLDAADHASALELLLPRLLEAAGREVAAVGHRVVHGGERFTDPVLVDAAVEAEIEALSNLAPLHNPINLAGIRAARRALPQLPHVAVFDTAFHATLPPRARTYALPAKLSERLGIRRYGFHGTSHG